MCVEYCIPSREPTQLAKNACEKLIQSNFKTNKWFGLLLPGLSVDLCTITALLVSSHRIFKSEEATFYNITLPSTKISTHKRIIM